MEGDQNRKFEMEKKTATKAKPKRSHTAFSHSAMRAGLCSKASIDIKINRGIKKNTAPRQIAKKTADETNWHSNMRVTTHKMI
jgi:hypothetical protein